ncbi:MAG: Short-chain dehydrogenase/reductase SDR, partial [uncultured Propionibacteriaceae bacterium]
EPAAVAAGVQRLEGGGPPPHAQPCRGVGAVRGARQRTRARLHRNRHDPGRRAGLPAVLDRRRADAPFRGAGGAGPQCCLPRRAGVCLHDRRDHGHRRRLLRLL